MKTYPLIPIVLILCAASASVAAEEGVQCTLHLVNGDEIRGRLTTFAEGRLTFYPQVSPESRIQLDLGKTERVDFGKKPKNRASAKGDLLRLLDGSVLHGRFVEITADALTFDIEGAGQVHFPRDQLDELSRTRKPPATVSSRPGQHVVVTTAGDVLYGNLDPQQDGQVTIRGGGVSARIALSSVACIFFPPAGEALTAKPTSKPTWTATVNTLLGSSLTGSDPELKEGRLHLTLAGGTRISLPVERVVDITFSSTGRAFFPRRILVWGTYADRNDEYRKVVAILRRELGKRWQITENFSELDSDFRGQLARSGVLFIPEMEQWRSSANKLAPRMKALAHPFLRRGGRIIILGPTTSHLGFLKNAELMDVHTDGSTLDNTDIPFTTAGRKLGKNLGKTFRTSNSTMFYRIKPGIKATAMAQHARGAPIVGRRVGRGWIIILGMDYCSSNDQVIKVLINAVTGPL